MHTDDFAQTLAPMHLLQHPFYQAWMAGTLSQTQLQDYAGQYSAHVDAFPRYLSAIHSLCEDSASRKLILENLNDEEGISFGVSHPELWLRFAEGMGLKREAVRTQRLRAGIENVIATFFRLARSSFHEGLGALYAYESQVPEIAQSKIEGLQSRYGIHDARTLEFFTVHKDADVHHREVIKGLLDALPAVQRAEALAASRLAAEALWNFLSDVYAENAPVAV